MTGLDWPMLLRAGLRGLRLTPAQFWQLTPAELQLMLARDGVAAGPLDRSGLTALMQRFPDATEPAPEQEEQDDDG